MKPADFDYVRNYVRSQAAIVIEPGKEYLVESRLTTLARREKIESIDILVERLRAKPGSDLHRRVVDAMTTNETSFFRDLHPFEALKKTILPELVQKRRPERQLNFWCGAASSGQESYSVLMSIAENFPEIFQWNFNFIATDLSTEVLAQAQSGKYSQLEVNRGLPAPLLVKYFKRNGESWEFDPMLRKKVVFKELNLMSNWCVRDDTRRPGPGRRPLGRIGADRGAVRRWRPADLAALPCDGRPRAYAARVRPPAARGRSRSAACGRAATGAGRAAEPAA
jgi:chemotaxis protein methyltransferase CheR